MKQRILLLFSAAVMLLSVVGCAGESKTSRVSDFNFDWKFTLLEDTTTLTKLPLADDNWRDLRLPHDWSVESSFSEDLEGCTGYLPGGVGVYQKHFVTTEDSSLKSTFILFDGVYNNAKFWLNGEYLGENPYGYSPVSFDLTDLLNEIGEENVITVYVDHSRYADSRWYTGSGIYRNVKLFTLNKLHIPIYGTFITTPEITDAAASVNIEVRVANELDTKSDFTINTIIVDGAGKQVAQQSDTFTVGNSTEQAFNQSLVVNNPKLWDTENPNMYKAITSIEVAGEVTDQVETPFGIRTLLFDKDKGFFLNGVSTFVKGVCLHHDGGLVGAAVPEGVWRRRLEELKAGGVNAIRTSHNPFSDEFLDICDEMGFLVQDEIFDEMDNPKDKRFNMTEREVLYHTRGYTEHFQEWGESDLKRTIIRDRNHPSVFMYSIGNEIEWTYPHYKDVSGLWDPGAGGYWNATPKLTPEQMKARYDALPEREYVLAETAERLAKWVKDVDTTRPVTSNLIIPVASCVTGYAAALDVVGVSYQIAQYDWCKKHFPDMMFTGNENSGFYEEWKSVTDNPMVFSMYMWTGIDYMGESNLRWPQKAWDGDMLDLAGFKKAGWNHFRAIWDDEPFAAIQTVPHRDSAYMIKRDGMVVLAGKGGTKWNNSRAKEIWNYEDGEKIIVEVVANLDEAELLLNGVSQGSRVRSESSDNIMRWAVPYQAGSLVAKGLDSNGKEYSVELKSASEPAGLRVEVDNTAMAADGYDVAHIVVQVVDKDGVEVQTEERKIEFEVDGDVTLMGVDNGWNKSTQDFQTDNVTTHLGRCLAIIQSKRDVKDSVTVTVKSEGLEPQSVKINVK